ncbi:MAG: hypothetical protein QG647_583, partial [Patescibacteria group bacterium]|nr:hypothetical protein [Patescibacteria group bacterium]
MNSKLFINNSKITKRFLIKISLILCYLCILFFGFTNYINAQTLPTYKIANPNSVPYINVNKDWSFSLVSNSGKEYIIAEKDNVLAVYQQETNNRFSQQRDYYYVNQDGEYIRQGVETFQCGSHLDKNESNSDYTLYEDDMGTCTDDKYYRNVVRVEKFTSTPIPEELLIKLNDINWGSVPKGCVPYSTSIKKNGEKVDDTGKNYLCPNLINGGTSSPNGSVKDGVMTGGKINADGSEATEAERAQQLAETNAAIAAAATAAASQVNCELDENKDKPECATAAATCTDALGVFGWLICEVGDKADFLVNFIEDALYDLLRVPELEVGSDVYQQWGVFRSMATSLLILIGLVAIAAQVFNLDFVSAYTMRKVIPKLIIATIMLFLSYYFLSLAITFVNALGDGVASLIMGPFADGQLLQQSKDGGAIAWILESGNFGAPDSTVAQTAAISMALVAFVTQGGAGLVVIGIMFVLFACLTAFVSLVIRKIMLLGLVMIAPLAIVAWILPSTEKWFKKWWETFSKLLIMYPLIMGLIAIGTVGAYLIAQTGDTMASIDPNVATNPLASPATIILFAAVFTGGITMLMVLVAYFAPYFFIPSMFKTAGSAFSAISNGLSSKGKQWGKSAAEYSSGGLNKALANKAANGRSYKYTNKLRRKLGREEKVGTAEQRRFYRGLSYVSQGAIIPEAMGGRASRAAAVSKNDKLVQEEKQQLETLVDVKLRGLNEEAVVEALSKMVKGDNQAMASVGLDQMKKRNLN